VSLTRDPHAPQWEDIHGAILLAGDANDIPEMVDIAWRLPGCASVTMFIEAATPVQVQHVDVPENVGVTWLVRGAPGISHPAGRGGARLGMAVHAWCAEWACPSADPDRELPIPCTAWLGPRTSSHVVRMTRALVEAV